MSAPTVVELFAGAGGLALGLEAAGFRCVAHAEVERHARAVLRRRWPGVPLLSDVAALSGGRKMRAWLQARFRDVDLVSGGSPCQDLSVAGKRAGIGGARSSLYFRQVRLWKLLGAPHFLWENVPGALSSNEGRDFALVLGAVVGAPVPVPADGWGRAGVVAGSHAVAAWRVLDLQHFGPPQRRARVFVLGARAGGVDPAEVLLEPEGVCRHPAPRREAGQGATARAGVRVASESGQGWWNDDEGGLAPLRADPGGMPSHIAFDWQKGNDVTNRRPSTMNVTEEQTGALGATRVPAVLAFHHTQDPITSAERRTALGTTTDGIGVLVLACGCGHEWWNPEGGWKDAPCPGCGETRDATLSYRDPAVCITGAVAHSLTHEGHDASEDGTGRGTPIVAGTLGGVSPGGGWRGDLDSSSAYPVTVGIPRRLMPIECERLMGWPETRLTYIFSVCYEPHGSGARAVLRSLRSPASASPAGGGECSATASNAAPCSMSDPAAPASAVVWRVEIAADPGCVRISNGQREWSYGANTAGALSSFARLVELARSVPKHVGSLDIAVPAPRLGEAASRASETPSAHPASGRTPREPSTPAIECASDAVSARPTRGRGSVKSTTSRHGANPPSGDSTWETLCSSVARVIAGFTHGTTSPGSSYLCELTVTDGHTAEGIDERGRPYRLSDAARYRLCGNGCGKQQAEWIGRRLIALLDTRASA